jgi:localization factor PodJL
MNSRVSWSVDGIDPSVRERAEAAARRAGLSLNDWINSNLGDAAPPNFRFPPQPARDVADIHQRLDSITSQIEQISRIAPRNNNSNNDASREQGVARQLNDAISRLDARLSQISNPQYARQAQERQQERQQRQSEAVERAAGQVYSNQAYSNQAYPNQAYPNQAYSNQAYAQQGYANGSYAHNGYANQAAVGNGHAPQAYRSSPPLSPHSLDFAVAEIAARQSELDAPPRAMPPRQTPPIAPFAPSPPPPPPPPQGPDFSALERHLFKITSQIEALQRPDHLEQSIAAFRNELGEIRAAITEAMPRRAIETIESEIRSLSRRIDDTRQSGIDGQALSTIERALAEIREVLRSLMPAEQLRGYDEAIRNLGAKLDTILRANDDPTTVHQLENAIAALRGIVSNVASNDALARLSEDVHLLSSKVDQLARSGNNNDSFIVLEQRIAALTSALESRERPVVHDYSEQIEGALRSLSDRIDRLQVGNDSASAFAHLEQRVSYLLERLEASGGQQKGSDIGRVEEGLQDILHHLERQHAAFANFTLENSRNAEPQTQPQQDSELMDLFKRELSDIRYSRSETDRQTQDSLEAVHSALGHVVDRLAMIEGDLREVRSAPPQAAAAPTPTPAAFQASTAFSAPPPASRPVVAEVEDEPLPMSRVAIPPQPKPELPNPATAQVPFVAAPRDFHAAEPVTAELTPPPTPLAISEILLPHATASAQPLPALEPDLPPDHPLEPGTRPSGRASSPSERIAASESAISEIPISPRPPVSSASFIAAARRAAQAAAAQPVGAAAPAKAAKSKGDASSITSKIRSLLVAASVVVIVLGTFKMAMTLLDGGSAPPTSESASEPQRPPPAETTAKPAAPEQVTPSMTSPTPIGRQSMNNATPGVTDASATVEIPQVPAAPTATQPSADITGAIPAASSRKGATAGMPALPDIIGGPVLRAAALKGDPAAAYEIGMRFADGKGVPQNFDDAAKWYDRAAQAGIVPALFRLGTFYEKGLGVKKDPDLARRYYLQAAERGSAKAMHNLAVLDADGGGKGANYKSAAQWFRKAADRGVADSQFNLGILYARGIGVEQNLAESFKWFSLAAVQGDADAARKRDDIAKRLDAQSLAAAKLAIQTFTAEPQPDDAVNVATPAGGWDSAAPQAATTRPVAKPAAKKTAAAR